MLTPERAENERLRQIINELQRYRFARRAERLTVEQLLLGLEEAEQIKAKGLPARRLPILQNGPSGPRSVASILARCRRSFYASIRSSTSS